MIAVVTGASGFVGQNLVRRLQRDGHEVRCLVRPDGGQPPPKVARFPVRFDESRSLLGCAAFEGADVVFHLAAATKAPGEKAYLAANVTPTRNLLGALCARRLAPRFVFVSSQAAAGPASERDRAVDEEDLPRPIEAYGRSKLEAERIVASFGDRIPATTIRPSSTFGPHDRDFLPLFRFAEHGLVVYPGVATHWLSVLHVDDVVAGLLAAATQPHAIGRTYFLSSETPVQWRTFGDTIAEAVGRRVRHVNLPSTLVQTASIAGDWVGWLTHRPLLANRSKAAMSRAPYWVCSGSRARLELGFRETRSLPDAIRDTYYWYRQRGWVRGPRGTGSAVA